MAKTGVRKHIPLIFYEDLALGDDRVIACAGSEIDFVGPDLEPNFQKSAREAMAKQVCAGCELRTECLAWAVRNYEEGIWGGLNDDERRAYRKSRSRRRVGDPTTKQQHDRVKRELTAWGMHLNGASNPEIAALLNVTEGTVYTYIRDQRKVQDAQAKQAAEADQGPEADQGSADRIESATDRPAEPIGPKNRQLVAGGRA